ncbi:2OG-Fe(II) oxygenase family protein [Nisaea sediminum]|uniref:2OG-Fe(II) oxygenase family protein n=1 Tax=Nisaea sediminum TaxID=2775867 RepID=UPI0018663F75|nr:2OG-Fe(II) oxygenase [Nisaea sediminum]
MAPAPAAMVRAVEQGDIAPPIALRNKAGGEFNLAADEVAGDFNIFVFLGHNAAANLAAVTAFVSARDQLAGYGARAYFVAAGKKWPELPADVDTGAVLQDIEGKAFSAFGQQALFGRAISTAPTTVLVAPNRHILRVLEAEWPDHTKTVLEELEAQSALRAAQPYRMHPPVLLMPDVFSPGDCRHLMSVYAMQGQEFVEPGHHKLQNRTTDCKMRIPDYGREDRIDHWVINPETQAYIDERIAKRLLPEIQKSFHYKVTRHERYRIACYQGERGGRAHGHRDNSSAMSAYRRFAVTINLNSDEYEGGEIWFPEFSKQSYKPPAGAAIVFSCSLLHEVLHMRKGRRFALLGFLFGES